MPPYTLAVAVWLALDHLADDVYGLWWTGSWAAAFTIIMIRVRPTIAGDARYWGAIVVGGGVNMVGVWATNVVLRNQVDLVATHRRRGRGEHDCARYVHRVRPPDHTTANRSALRPSRI